MMTWLTPIIRVGLALGSRMRHSICRRVQPVMRPSSWISAGTRCSARVVARTIGGMAKATVAISGVTGVKPNRNRVGMM